MKRILLVLFSLLFVLGACSDDTAKQEPKEDEANNQEESNKEPEKDTVEEEEKAEDPVEEEEQTSGEPLEDIVNHFESQGFEIGEQTMKAYDMVGATDGFGIQLNGTEIELYLYDSESPDLKAIQSNGEYNMDGFVFPAIANGNIVIIAHDEHPETDKIIEVFNSY